MSNLEDILKEIFIDTIKQIEKDKNCIECSLVSKNLKTNIISNSLLCSTKLLEFSNAFNSLLKTNNSKDPNLINVHILEDENIFEKIELLFNSEQWSTDDRIKDFNLATANTSCAKCTSSHELYVIKCYEYFYYTYNVKTNECLMIIKKNKKALTMVNILLLTPYLLYGDLYAVHGGLVSDGKNNVLLSNSSLGGKTTFALLFLTNGWDIITEETTYITNQGKILNYNIRNYFNVRAGTYLEFKDFFIKSSIINDNFLSMANMKKEELFEFGKKEQMSIDFDTLCNSNNTLSNNKITHTLKVSIDKDKRDMFIEKSCPTENVDRFLELSLAPTVMLFNNLVNYNNLDKAKRKNELLKIFENINSYSVVSGFNYKEKFEYLINNINI